MRALIVTLLVACSVLLPTGAAAAGSVSWHFQELTPSAQALLGKLEEQGVFVRLGQQLHHHVTLDRPIRVVFYPGADAFFDPQRDEILIPLSVLMRMQTDVAKRFPMQQEVQRAVYTVAAEYMLWYHLARVLVSQYQLPAGSDAEHSIDALALLAMLDSPRDINQLYLLDATEVFLVSMPAFQLWGQLSARSNDEQIEARYRLAVCLVLGEDHEQFPELEGEIAWPQKTLDACQRRLQQARQAWAKLLLPQLTEWSPWRRWGQQMTLLNAVEGKAEEF